MSIRPTTPTPLDHIVDLAKAHAADRDRLRERVTALDDELRATQRRHLHLIRNAARQTRESLARLQASIEAAPSLFTKPRTIEVHGLKLGYEKGRGKLVMADEAKTITLIRRHLDETTHDTLIITKETVDRRQAAKLSPTELRKIAAEITGTEDTILIKPTDAALDKLVSKILEETKDLED